MASSSLDVRFQLLQAETAAKSVPSSKVPGSEYVVDADTTLADRRSLEFCRMNLGVTQIPRDTVQVLLRLLFLCHAHTRASAIMSSTSCLWELFTVLYVAAATKFCSKLMNHDSDSENVRRLWHGSPQPSGCANIERCFSSCTPLVNLHHISYEHVIIAAPVLTISDTCFLSVLVV